LKTREKRRKYIKHANSMVGELQYAIEENGKLTKERYVPFPQ